jgi:hypothetical protein
MRRWSLAISPRPTVGRGDAGTPQFMRECTHGSELNALALEDSARRLTAARCAALCPGNVWLRGPVLELNGVTSCGGNEAVLAIGDEAGVRATCLHYRARFRDSPHRPCCAMAPSADRAHGGLGLGCPCSTSTAERGAARHLHAVQRCALTDCAARRQGALGGIGIGFTSNRSVFAPLLPNTVTRSEALTFASCSTTVADVWKT